MLGALRLSAAFFITAEDLPTSLTFSACRPILGFTLMYVWRALPMIHLEDTDATEERFDE